MDTPRPFRRVLASDLRGWSSCVVPPHPAGRSTAAMVARLKTNHALMRLKDGYSKTVSSRLSLRSERLVVLCGAATPSRAEHGGDGGSLEDEPCPDEIEGWILQDRFVAS